MRGWGPGCPLYAYFSMAMVFPEPGEWEKRVFLLLDEVECELVFTDDPGPEPLVSPYTHHGLNTTKTQTVNVVFTGVE